MKHRIKESELRNMIRECIEDALYEGKAPEFANNNELYRIANNGDMRRGGNGQRRSFPITKNWDDPEYADTARTKSGREFNLQKEGKARDTFNKAVKYGKKQLNKFNQSIKDLTDEYDEDGNPIVDNPMYKGKKSNNESRLRRMIREAVKSALNENENVPYEAWSEFLNGREPLFEFEDGIIYVDYDENKGTLCSGGVTNIGFHKDGEVEVPVIDGDFQSALEEVYSQLACNHEPLEY